MCQGQYNFFDTSAADSLFTLFEELGIGFMSWGTLEKGILTGRVTAERTYDATDVRNHAPWWTSVDHTPHYETMDQLTPVLRDQGHTGLSLALGFVLSSPVLATALCGARTVAQLEGLNAALDNLPSQDLITECSIMRCNV